jgi:large subunit ribosomal protein L7/L12
MSVAAPMCARRWYTTEQPLPTPGSSANADPKITAIVDQIEGLTLLQTSELVAQLKVNIMRIYNVMCMKKVQKKRARKRDIHI